ncbi:helix-turn-helix domain-containing protein [Pseudactinotalea sp. Z1732]|uniref:helix-turn-helix domain-containing protein n=1 Tax=Micrococcales TaxID=85006 RepID=UPI003C7EC88A
MINAQEIRDARQRGGMTQAELAQRVGVSQRTVGNWERGESIPRNRAAKIRAVLADHLSTGQAAPLRSASDAELLAEIARRFERAKESEEVVGNAKHPAPIENETNARPARFGLAAMAGEPGNPPDTTTGEETQVPPGEEDGDEA